ncbi:hypothetical protein SDC9_76483 [bioreactor metagenome]|uniref:Uncharacterized protein n=1 Tax=bioreactor metagenome TaxID=1076179 RepID=A0A644YQ02_9ZZZZ
MHRGPASVADRDITFGGGLGCRLEQRRIDHPAECPRLEIDQIAAVADLDPSRPEQLLRALPLPGGEEDRIAGLGAGGGHQCCLFFVREVLGDRPGELAGLVDRDVGQPAGAALLGPLLPGVELAAGLGGRRASRRTLRRAPGKPGTRCRRTVR